MYDKNVCPDSEPNGCIGVVMWAAILGVIIGFAILIYALTLP